MRLLSLLLISACADKGSSVSAPDDTASTPGDSDTETDPGDTDPPPDADGDGYDTTTDCDDDDAAINPGAAEICDGIDQDCDGVVDDGVPSDGAGCQDPGAPTFPETIDTLHIEIRTKDGSYDGTDDPMYVCLSDDRCFSLNKAEWNDLEEGVVDIYAFEDLALARSAVEGFTIKTTEGDDQWEPACFSLRFDGEPVYCQDDLDLKIGNEVAGEVPEWTEPDALASHCTTCSLSPLTHGPILGAVTDTTANIWYRTDATRAVRLRVATSADALNTAAPVHYGYPAASTDFTQTVTVQGLSAGQTVYYDLEIEGVRHGPWSLQTAPAPDGPVRTRMAFGSCSKDDDQPIFGVIAAWDPDIFLFVGDNHYGNTSELSDLRQYYRWAHERSLRAELMSETVILATWDDHDFVGNNTDGSDAGKEVALRVFSEYWANGSYGTETTEGVFSQHRYGDVAFFLLDDRYWRGIDDDMLGSEQEAWLLSALSDSDATFKFLVSGSQWSLEGSSDSWGAFEASQTRLREALVSLGIEGVVLLSGDIHRSELRLLSGATGGYDLPELVSSPLATWNSSCGSSSELKACTDDDTFFIAVDIDTTLEDPTLSVSLVDSGATVRASWTILRSELSL